MTSPLQLAQDVLKGCGNGSLPCFCGETYNDIKNDLCDKCKSKALGLLSAFINEKEFLETLRKRVHRNFDRKDLLEVLRNERGGVCQVCKNKSGNTIHHIIPRRLKGKDNIENLILICQPCHTMVDSLLYQGDMTSRIDVRMRLKKLTSAIDLLEKNGISSKLVKFYTHSSQDKNRVKI